MKRFVRSILRDMGFIRAHGLDGVDRGLSREDKEFCYRQMAK
jgi:hypothetical protein